MKRRVSVFAALVLVLSLAAVAAAEERKATAKKAPKAHRLTGTVEAVDSAAGTLSVKGKKGFVALKAGEKVNLDRIAVGDKVLVLYSGDTAASVKMVPAKKKAAGKAAAAPAAPATPAIPAAPAEQK